ncbi:MAG: hypothetical protein CK532_04095 [Flavobacteriales bacterium]|nr:MAG: hypothetical protein CK532_04095 [Flavobacteriales bacterium]
MKKSYLALTLPIFCSLSSFAQIASFDIPKEQKNIHQGKTTFVLKGKTLQPVRRSESYSSWYNYTGAYEESTLLGQKLSGYVSFIYPDTTLYTVYADGTKQKIGFHVFGNMFDPKDTNFLGVGNQVLTRFNPYTVDSLAFTQFYIRLLDKTIVAGKTVDVVDTVYIQYFDFTGIKTGGYTYNATPKLTHRYATPNTDKFSTKSLLNSAAIRTDTLLLTASEADSLVYENGTPKSFIGRGIQIPVNVKALSTSGANGFSNLFAFTVVYKPMVKCVLGDTGIAYDGSKWTKKYNSYGVRLASLADHSQEIFSTNKINNMFASNFQLRYGSILFGFLKSYLPGTLFASSIFFPNFLKISTLNLSSQNIQTGISGIQVYPNPVSNNSQTDVVFMLSSNASVRLVLSDMNGRVVSAISAKQFVAGTNSIVVNTEGLSKGIYVLTLESAVGRMTSKLTIN